MFTKKCFLIILSSVVFSFLSAYIVSIFNVDQVWANINCKTGARGRLFVILLCIGMPFKNNCYCKHFHVIWEINQP